MMLAAGAPNAPASMSVSAFVAPPQTQAHAGVEGVSSASQFSHLHPGYSPHITLLLGSPSGFGPWEQYDVEEKRVRE